MSFNDIWLVLHGGGDLAFACALIYALMRGWIVPQYVYTVKVDECEEWKKQVSTRVGQMDRAIELAELVKELQPHDPERRRTPRK